MIEAFFAIDPGSLRINAAFKCTCRGGHGKMYSAADHKKAKAAVAKLAALAWGDDLPVYPDGPVVVEYEVRPAQVHRKGPAVGQGRLDVDAASKAFLDALNSTAYADDSQVERVVGSKTTEGPVGIRVRIYRPDEELTRA